MGDSNTELIKAVIHYQQCLEKYTRRNNEPRMLYCIGKLYKMPITVEHLEQTGVGRTVNSLRKCNGEVGEAAKSLVAKWKEMVVGEDNESKDSSAKPESSRSHREESKHRKHKEGSSSSSHKESDKKSKHDCKEKSSSSFSNGEESHSKKIKEEFKYKKSEENYKRDKESNYQKHKSTKRKQSSDNSESDDRDYEKGKSSNHKHKSSHQSSKRKQASDNSDSDDNEYEKMKSDSYYKHKLSRQKAEESEDESRYKIEKDKREDHKQKLMKRKREDSDYDDEEYEEINVKRNKYSEEESESEVEEKEVKSVSHKYQSKQKDEPNDVIKEKQRHSSSKHKDKKEKKEHLPETQQKKSNDDHKMRDKHSNKEKAKSSSEKKEKEENGKKSKQSSSKHHHEKEHKSPKKSSSQSKGKVTVHANGIGSDSGTSFAEALGMLEPSSSKTNKKKIAVIHPFPLEKPIETNNSSPDISKAETSDLLIQKRLEPLDINISNLLPEISPNYRPIGNCFLDNGQLKSKVTAEEEALSAIMYSKISRTKVYSGNKVIYGKVPTLFDLCTHVLQDNIDALEYTGGVPYTILKPVIERANPDQLFMLEHHNPYLIEDTDELWQLHCQKEFRTKKREEMETWRDMYMRCLDEREAKLKALTANIKQSQDKSIPVRQTKLAYVDGHSIVKPPRSIARKQAKHGTAGVEKKPLVTPSSRLSALATAGAAGQIAVPNPGSRAASAAGSSSAVIKPKKAPLMQKTLAFMKNRLFRR